MRRFVEFEGDHPVLREDEAINYTLADVEVAFSPDNVLGLATLYVTNQRVLLIGNGDDSFNLDIDVPFIGLHAVSTSGESYPKPCMYCQLNQEDPDDGPDEVFLAPNDVSLLIGMFEAFCHAAELNPDLPEDGEEEGDDELIYDLDEVELGAAQAQTLAHLESVFRLPGEKFGGDEVDCFGEGQFEDADEGESDEEEDGAVDAEVADTTENKAGGGDV